MRINKNTWSICISIEIFVEVSNTARKVSYLFHLTGKKHVFVLMIVFLFYFHRPPHVIFNPIQMTPTKVQNFQHPEFVELERCCSPSEMFPGILALPLRNSFSRLFPMYFCYFAEREQFFIYYEIFFHSWDIQILDSLGTTVW